MKSHTDACHHATGSSLQLGNWVLVRQRQARKAESPFLSRPLRIMNIKGSMITVEAGSYSITRNSSHVKEFWPSDVGEGEPLPSAGQQTPSADAGGSVETALSIGDSHRQAEDTSEDIGQEKGRSRLMQMSRKPRRLIEEL
ncbi:hypothetical protein NDU88_005207 [Pleurodeles waltl]|uniref:Uncharacterized protein n=1 Tax=Pleurodeles waltl TaxID=8319 RepID=A0AAV7WC23_PLEWA|nr:hypothetical protein NDU88_005207 [Pleurodeles waltl]